MKSLTFFNELGVPSKRHHLTKTSLHFLQRNGSDASMASGARSMVQHRAHMWRINFLLFMVSYYHAHEMLTQLTQLCSR